MNWFRTILGCEKKRPVRRKFTPLTTEFLLSEALDLGLISDLDAAEFYQNMHCYPLNWARYNPNIYLKKKLSDTDRTRFFIALMRYHNLGPDASPYDICLRQIMYLPRRGQQYKQMLANFK